MRLATGAAGGRHERDAGNEERNPCAQGPAPAQGTAEPVPRGAALRGLRNARMKIAERMTGDPCSIQQDQPLRQAHRLMQKKGVRHLPVLDGDELVGLVSERDLYLLE